MRKFAILTAAAASMALIGCGPGAETETEVAAENMEAKADQYDAAADAATNEAGEELMEDMAADAENKADVLEDQADAEEGVLAQ